MTETPHDPDGGRSYRHDLSRELTAVGIPSRRRERILAEFADHLACDPQAELGEPQALARQFADELGTAYARRAVGQSFAALALAGLLFGVAFAIGPGPAFGPIPAAVLWPGRVANLLALLAPQFAFVAGVLAGLRALRRRRARVIVAAEAGVLLRRTATALAAAIVSMASLGVMAIELRSYVAGSWVTLAEVGSVVGLLALAAALPSLLAARRLRPLTPGPAGDLSDDFGRLMPPFLRGHPWRFALIVAAGVFIAITAAGAVASDGYDGAIRGLGDALLCLLGFATLGRYLGLWTPARR
ncbi:MAG: hypothetical protein M3016_05560 [Actinomycetota bacterium]|nr:hypothetical protein [Actinomycetota bacterium]